MSLRTRLILAFFLLAVVPLSGVSLYSYLTTERAYRRAVEAEATATAEDLNSRLGTATRDLGQRFERLSELPFAAVAAGPRPADDIAARKLMADLQREMGDAAPLLKWLEFTPALPAAEAAGVPGAPPPPGHSRAGVPGPPPPPPESELRRALVIAPEPPSGPEDSSAPAQPVWVMKYKAIAEAAAAVGSEIAKEAQRVESEVARQQAESDRQLELAREATAREQRAASQEQKQAERELRLSAKQAQREAAQAQREAGQAQDALQREAARQQAREELAHKAVRFAQLAMSPDEKDQKEGGRLAAETAALALRHAGEVIAHQARMRFAPRSGYSFDYKLRKNGAEVGTVRAQLKPNEVLAGVFSRTRRRQGEIPFAVDADGKLYAADAERSQLAPLHVEAAASAGAGTRTESRGDWVVVTRKDEDTGLTLGIARPLGSGLKDIRSAALKNLVYGLGMTGLALIGILPLSHRLTRDLGALTEGASKLAHGDLDARVPVRSGDEVGRLAEAFNRMAGDLRAHQEQLLQQERLRKELELGRRIQSEMLPHEGLHAPFAEAKGVSIPAREVGGDFFDYFLLDDGRAALIVGDVSGKGVGAALLMANLQATLRARLPLENDLTALARHLDHEIDRTTSTTVYLTAVIGVLDGKRGVMRYVNAGHNPPFVLRRDGGTEALHSTGRPLGLYPGGDYEEKQIAFNEGDSLLLYTDGITESENDAGDPFGAERLQELLVANRAVGLDGVLALVESAVREHRGGREADDDATLLLLKIGPTTAA